uniref:RING-type domain-containing protein n=1 Tax=Chromera velia CCMP2878 TaxID=1169474 RepID=A0A0G4FUL3_9ALVE|eukprot:Cvel_18785.t1-p1 / transcript=Cvel_18785.t1 / gene=Cvel_18785 / organism=Chromera_velia_CCMP2878 / gene_product=E3 ubiquitin-protein ligase Mdm2, putative / transcript_product=E3 ubiquitin-protein ligase Mdm2, putative / location=Cvel_scaffold1577:10103-15001(-) / protein_length=749 / sequence_SO=supercontig / SO=protein_coding / is_pseudo=false
MPPAPRPSNEEIVKLTFNITCEGAVRLAFETRTSKYYEIVIMVKNFQDLEYKESEAIHHALQIAEPMTSIGEEQFAKLCKDLESKYASSHLISKKGQMLMIIDPDGEPCGTPDGTVKRLSLRYDADNNMLVQVEADSDTYTVSLQTVSSNHLEGSGVILPSIMCRVLHMLLHIFEKGTTFDSGVWEVVCNAVREACLQSQCASAVLNEDGTELKISMDKPGGSFDILERVRVKPEMENMTFGFGNMVDDCRHDVGLVVDHKQTEKGLAVVVNFPEAPSFKALKEELCRDEEAAKIQVGSLIRVKPSIDNPRFEWGAVAPGLVGRVFAISANGIVEADFPSKQCCWKAPLGELEAVDPKECPDLAGMGPALVPGEGEGEGREMEEQKEGEGGSAQAASSQADSPGTKGEAEGGGNAEGNTPTAATTGVAGAGTAGPSSPSTDPEQQSGKDKPSPSHETGERQRYVKICDGFSLGDRVRLKDDVGSPVLGSGNLRGSRGSDVGVVRGLKGGSVKVPGPDGTDEGGMEIPILCVAFPADRAFKVLPQDIEIDQEAERISVGAPCRLKPTIAKPLYGWGRVPHGMIGKVTKVYDDGDVIVAFPGLLKKWRTHLTEILVVSQGGGKQRSGSSMPFHLGGSPGLSDVGTSLVDAMDDSAGDGIKERRASNNAILYESQLSVSGKDDLSPGGQTAVHGGFRKCHICRETAADHVFVHGKTGHMVACKDCAEQVERKTGLCPVCRQKVESVVHVFFS